MNLLVNEVELLQANPHYSHVHHPDCRKTTVARKHLVPKGHMEAVETLPAPARIPEEAEILPLETSVNVTPDAEPSSAPKPEPEPQPNLHLYRMRNLHLLVAHSEFVVPYLDLIFKGQGEFGRCTCKWNCVRVLRVLRDVSHYIIIHYVVHVV